MAIWFHDAVYDVHAHDNEARSASLACDYLSAAGVDRVSVSRTQQLILATRHHSLPTEGDEQVVVDIDLAILGSDAQRFSQYDAQIREEYAHVADSQFRVKRYQILNDLLGRYQIYGTPYLRQLFEDRARRNLEAALSDLRPLN